MVTYTIALNITPGRYPPRIYLSQYDSLFTLQFDLYCAEGAFSFTGLTAAVRGTKLDGNGYSAEASINGNRVTVNGDEQMTAIAGENVFEIVLYRGENELSTSNFILDVKRATLDKDTIVSRSVIRELVDVSDSAQLIVDAAARVEDAAYNIGLLQPQMQQLHDETVAAAETVANDVREELRNDIRTVNTAKTYIEEYISGLIYGDEVSY